MRAEKQYLSNEYAARLNASPFFLAVDYRGLSVAHFGELRRRLRAAGAEVHVVKNSLFRLAAKEAGLGDLGSCLTGQLAIVTGQRDVSVAAKALKSFRSEFQKPQVQFGGLGRKPLTGEEILTLADLPSLEQLRGMVAGLLNQPATRLARLLQTPARQLARVIQAKAERGG